MKGFQWTFLADRSLSKKCLARLCFLPVHVYIGELSKRIPFLKNSTRRDYKESFVHLRHNMFKVNPQSINSEEILSQLHQKFRHEA